MTERGATPPLAQPAWAERRGRLAGRGAVVPTPGRTGWPGRGRRVRALYGFAWRGYSSATGGGAGPRPSGVALPAVGGRGGSASPQRAEVRTSQALKSEFWARHPREALPEEGQAPPTPGPPQRRSQGWRDPAPATTCAPRVPGARVEPQPGSPPCRARRRRRRSGRGFPARRKGHFRGVAAPTPGLRRLRSELRNAPPQPSRGQDSGARPAPGNPPASAPDGGPAPHPQTGRPRAPPRPPCTPQLDSAWPRLAPQLPPQLPLHPRSPGAGS